MAHFLLDHRPPANPGREPQVSMPAGVRPDQVCALVEFVSEAGGRIAVPKLAEDMEADLTVLPDVMAASRLLGLADEGKDEVWLTEFGVVFQKEPRQKLKLLTGALARLEPFRATLEATIGGKELTSDQVARALFAKGISWHYQSDVNLHIVHELLIEWALSTGLLALSGSGKFRKTG